MTTPQHDEERAGETCAHSGCSQPATQLLRRGRIAMGVCAAHGNKIVAPVEFKPSSTGSKEADRRLNRAIDVALLRITPILRDILRKEIREQLQLED